LAREPPVAGPERDRELGCGRRLERFGVDEQQLLLGADRERRHAVEHAPQTVLEGLRPEHRLPSEGCKQRPFRVGRESESHVSSWDAALRLERAERRAAGGGFRRDVLWITGTKVGTGTEQRPWARQPRIRIV